MSKTNDDSYPYTYAAYQILMEYGPSYETIFESGTGKAGFTEGRPILTISQADKILHGICRDADLNVRKVAETLADRFLKSQNG